MKQLKDQKGDIAGWALGLAITALAGVLGIIGFFLVMTFGGAKYL